MTVHPDTAGAARAAASAGRVARRTGRALAGLSGAERLGLAIVAFILAVAAVGPWLATHDPFQSDFMAINRAPRADNWLDAVKRFFEGIGQ